MGQRRRKSREHRACKCTLHRGRAIPISGALAWGCRTAYNCSIARARLVRTRRRGRSLPSKSNRTTEFGPDPRARVPTRLRVGAHASGVPDGQSLQRVSNRHHSVVANEVCASNRAAMSELRDNLSGKLADISSPVDERFFLDQAFIIGSVNTKTFVLVLAQQSPLSFVSGQPVALDQVFAQLQQNGIPSLFSSGVS